MTEPLRLPLPKEPPAPSHLSREARSIWRSVARSFDLESHHLLVLGAVCESLDRMRSAQAQIWSEGITVPGRFGPRPHPAVAIERDSRLAMLRAIAALGLDIEIPSGRARTEAARAARW